MSKAVVLFDIDGTLLSTGGAGGRAMHAALEHVYGVCARNEKIAYAGRCDFAIFGDLLKIAGQPDTAEHRLQLKTVYLDFLEKELHAQDASLLPGVDQLLVEFSEKNHISVGLLTGNLQKGAELKLRHFKIEHYFKYGGYGDDIGCRNELAKSMLPLIEQNCGSVAPDSVWVIGDTPADVACARAMGAKCVAVATGAFTVEDLEPTKPDYLFEDLSTARDWHSKYF